MPSAGSRRQRSGAARKTTEVHCALGYATADELLLHLPLRYEDETRLTRLRNAPAGVPCQVEGTIDAVETHGRPRPAFSATLREPGSGELFRLRLLHFYPGQITRLVPGAYLRLFGELRMGLLGAEMVHPRWQVTEPSAPLATTMTPVYPTVAGLSQTRIRRAIAPLFEGGPIADSLPGDMLAKRSLPGFEASLRLLHGPPPDCRADDLEARRHPAWRRIKFDELLAQQLSLRLYTRQRRRHGAPRLTDPQHLVERLLATLPFPLTTAQQRVLAEIRADLSRPHPMHRLLQGDVGSGKTCVAALAVLTAVGSGRQAAVMAPTDLLAEQLYGKFREWLAPLDVGVAWLAGSIRGRARGRTLDDIGSGQAAVAVGTHALFQDDVRFRNLALAVVDEQHRFGVAQRLAMRGKGANGGDSVPHLLMMSATPIPRSLAMSYFADLDVSVIDQLPPGRQPVATRVLGAARRPEVIERLRDYCRDGAQAYWVCPLIEESEKLSVTAALEAHAELTSALPDLRIGLVHGRLKPDEKAAAMAAFKTGEIDVLVATTVIEVGVDVANASLMVIEHAERLGLAQLHQLRGRVGRGGRVSTCVLMYADPLSESARQRLRILREHADGFAIAREDLRLRGPGEFLGARQSGVPLLRFADLQADQELLEQARDVATRLLDQDPDAVRAHLARWLPRGGDWMAA